MFVFSKYSPPNTKKTQKTTENRGKPQKMIKKQKIKILLGTWEINKTCFSKLCSILDFLVNFTLNYEGFADFSILPFDNERVFFNSVKSGDEHFIRASTYQK